ncbi:MAG: CarD family transcriptional regulator [Acidobacteria bacterium]|nr:CarD family transcriptional regulator [Acidobacteriota bacterium]
MEFQVGDKLVYPSQGVSVVERVGDEELAGQTFRCYHLRLLSTNSKVMVPVGNSERVGLRRLADHAEVEAAMERLRGAGGDDEHDWKDRYRANLDRIKTGDLNEIVDVLLCLADVASRKTLSFRERKMFDHAQQLLVYEVAEVEGRTVEEVEQEIGGIVQDRVGSALEEDDE